MLTAWDNVSAPLDTLAEHATHIDIPLKFVSVVISRTFVNVNPAPVIPVGAAAVPLEEFSFFVNSTINLFAVGEILAVLKFEAATWVSPDVSKLAVIAFFVDGVVPVVVSISFKN